jgi:alkaline phosphatase D
MRPPFSSWFGLLLSLMAVAAMADEVPSAVGDVTPDGAVVWARLPEPGVVTLSYRSRGGEPRSMRAEAVADDDHVVRFELSRLAPGTRYGYEVRFAPPGGAARYVAAGEFATAPPASSRSPVRLAWSGDLSGQNICRDRDRGFPVFEALIEADPDLFVAAGDMIYADVSCKAEGRLGNAQVPNAQGPARDVPGFRRHWHYVRADPQLRRFLATVPYFATWDDHEVLNNFGPEEDLIWPTPGETPIRLMPMGLFAFLEQNPIRRNSEDPWRIYRSFRWGRHLHLFLLDTRQYRAPGAAADDAPSPKSMLGQAQRDWLVRSAGASDATWQVIVSGSPLVIPTGPPDARDGWAAGGGDTGYARELRSIVDDLRSAGADNVLWLSADVHFAAFFRHRPEDDYEFFEAVAGPLNAGMYPNPAYDRVLGSERLFMHPARGEMTTFDAALGWFNFGLVEIDADGEAVVRYVDARGRDLWRVTLPPRTGR